MNESRDNLAPSRLFIAQIPRLNLSRVGHSHVLPLSGISTVAAVRLMAAQRLCCSRGDLDPSQSRGDVIACELAGVCR